jgi:hypothetical protein
MLPWRINLCFNEHHLITIDYLDSIQSESIATLSQ